jgi:hypothetical protein
MTQEDLDEMFLEKEWITSSRGRRDITPLGKEKALETMQRILDWHESGESQPFLEEKHASHITEIYLTQVIEPALKWSEYQKTSPPVA